MKVVSQMLTFKTKGFTDIIDITDMIQKELSACKFKDGIVVAICPGSTGALTSLEYESGLIEDLKNFFAKVIPSNKKYAHDARWGDGNGFSHLRSSLIGPSLSIPFKDERLVLGTWQQIVFIDFDNRPRSRNIHLQFLGD